MSLDVKKLKNVVHHKNGVIIAQCPACAADGQDREDKNHLIIFPGGGYGCVLFPQGTGDAWVRRKMHLKHIFQLVGIRDFDDAGGVGGVGGQNQRISPTYGKRKTVMSK